MQPLQSFIIVQRVELEEQKSETGLIIASNPNKSLFEKVVPVSYGPEATLPAPGTIKFLIVKKSAVIPLMVDGSKEFLIEKKDVVGLIR